MQKINKKGLSSILQVTLISVLSIISLLLIWGYVKDLTNMFDNQLSPAVDCINQKSKILSACINAESQIELNLEIGLGEKINNLFINSDGESFTCDSSCSSCTILEQDSQGKKTIYLNPKNSNPNSLVTSINGCALEKINTEKC